MVAKYFINGGNTDTDLNWSLSSGGANDTVKPTIADNVTFDQAVNAIVDAPLNCLDLLVTINNNIDVNNDINVEGDFLKTSNGNMTIGGGNVVIHGNTNVNGGGIKCPMEFVGDDSTLDFSATHTTGILILNKNVGKKLTILSDINILGFFADWFIEEGTLDLGAFNLTHSSGDFTQNGGSVTSTTGILNSTKFFLNDGVFDPFKAISSTSSTTALFTDSATLNLMPSGGDFEFKGSNHWTINQNFTEFPHLIINKCVSCTQTGTWYAQDLTQLNNSPIGTGFLRGNLVGSGFSTFTGSGVTFDGTGAQEVTGEVSLAKITFNKISGSVTFNNNVQLYKCEVIAGASLVDFGTTLFHIRATGSHLNAGDWLVTGLEFYDLELEIASSGNGVLNNTVVLNDFTVTQTANLGGDITIGGNLTINDTSVVLTADITLNGTTDQKIYVEGGLANNLRGLIEINKTMGIVALSSDLGDDTPLSTLILHLINGILCTNGFDIHVYDLTIDVGTVIQKVSPTVITVDGTTTNNGAIVDIAGCSTGIVV